VKNRFKSLLFKCNLQRYTVVILPGGVHAPAAGAKTATWTWDRVNTKEDVVELFRECFPDAFGGGGGGASSSFTPPSGEECERVLAQTAR
jgi:hypothetical protein